MAENRAGQGRKGEAAAEGTVRGRTRYQATHDLERDTWHTGPQSETGGGEENGVKSRTNRTQRRKLTKRTQRHWPRKSNLAGPDMTSLTQAQ